MPKADDYQQAEANRRCAATLLAALVAGGVREVIISPGSRNTPLVLAAADHPEVRTWPVLDERSAGFFALGIARASRAPAALICTSGSAGAHYLPSVIEARYSNIPLVVITADRPAELHGCGAPQTMPQNALFGEFVGFQKTLAAPDPQTDEKAWADLGCEALNVALAEPHQPIHLNVAFREPLWRAKLTASDFPTVTFSPQASVQPIPRPDEIVRLAQMLAKTDCGIIYCGPMANVEQGLGEALTELAKILGWPVFCEAASGLRFGPVSRAVQVSGYHALVQTEFGRSNRPEHVLHFGRAPTSRQVGEYFAHDDIPETTLVSVDGRIHDPHRRASRIVRSAYLPLVNALNLTIEPHAGSGRWCLNWVAAEARLTQFIEQRFPTTALWEGSAVWAVFNYLPEGVAVHVANSMSIREVDAWCASSGVQRQVFASRGMNGIDGTLSTAAGEAMVNGPLCCILGDLALFHDASALGLVAEQNMNVVVLDNRGGGIFQALPIAAHPTHFNEYFRTAQTVFMSSLCDAYGVKYQRVDSLETLAQAMTQASHDRGGHLIHVQLTPTQPAQAKQVLLQAIDRVIGELD